MAKIGWGRILAGVAAAAAAGATYAYFRERSGRSLIHQTLKGEGAFEIRRYPALLVAETVQHGSRDRALGNGFGLLADYLFGEQREGGELPMTIPMFALPEGGGSWRVRFIMPDGHGKDDLPEPGPGITFVELSARDMAAVKFGGKPNDRLLAAKEADLRGWVAGTGREAIGVAEQAYYNSPLRPGPVRQNEVLVPLK